METLAYVLLFFVLCSTHLEEKNDDVVLLFVEGNETLLKSVSQWFSHHVMEVQSNFNGTFYADEYFWIFISYCIVFPWEDETRF